MTRLRDWTLQYSMIWASSEAGPGDCDCPEGFSSLGDECVKISTLPTEQPPTHTPLLMTKKGNAVYSSFGVRFFDAGYTLEGLSTYEGWSDGSVIHFWANPTSVNNYQYGAMNRTAIWSSSVSNYQQIGFSVCFNIPTSKTYLIGFGVDNYMILRVDGQEVLHHNPFVNQHDPTGANDDRIFKYWNVYPVTLRKGFHVIEIIANNDQSVAAVGAEIYDATKEELKLCTNQAELDPYLIFSTKDLLSTYTNLGTNGYPIVAGYALVLCSGEIPFYRKVEYEDCIIE